MAKKNAKTVGETTLSNAQGVAPGTDVAVLSAEPAAALPQVPGVAINAAVSRDELVAIVMAEAETKLEAGRIAATQAAQHEGALAAQKKEQLKKLIDEAPIAALEKKVEALADAAAPLGIKLTAKYGRGDARRDGTFKVEARIEFRSPSSGSYGTSVTIDDAQPLTAEMAALQKEIVEHERIQREQTTIAADKRAKLSKLSSLERMAKAKLAKVVLNQSVAGRAMYDQLVAELGTQVDAVPALRTIEDGVVVATADVIRYGADSDDD